MNYSEEAHSKEFDLKPFRSTLRSCQGQGIATLTLKHLQPEEEIPELKSWGKPVELFEKELEIRPPIVTILFS